MDQYKTGARLMKAMQRAMESQGDLCVVTCDVEGEMPSFDEELAHPLEATTGAQMAMQEVPSHLGTPSPRTTADSLPQWTSTTACADDASDCATTTCDGDNGVRPPSEVSSRCSSGSPPRCPMDEMHFNQDVQPLWRESSSRVASKEKVMEIEKVRNVQNDGTPGAFAAVLAASIMKTKDTSMRSGGRRKPESAIARFDRWKESNESEIAKNRKHGLSNRNQQGAPTNFHPAFPFLDMDSSDPGLLASYLAASARLQVKGAAAAQKPVLRTPPGNWSLQVDPSPSGSPPYSSYAALNEVTSCNASALFRKEGALLPRNVSSGRAPMGYSEDVAPEGMPPLPTRFGHGNTLRL